MVRHLTREEAPDWMPYKGQVNLIIFKLENLIAHLSASMSSNSKRMSFPKKIDRQTLLPEQQVPPLLLSPPAMSLELKSLMSAFTRRQVINSTMSNQEYI